MADPVDGQLVGETSDRVYLTATSADRIVSLSRDEYGVVYTGDDARATPCRIVNTAGP
jgi:hypothetical protein